MSKENLKNNEDSFPMEDMNNKNDETTPLTKQEEKEVNDTNKSGLEEKLSLEKDTEAAQTSKRKNLTSAIQAAEDIFENPKIRLLFAIIGATLLFLIILIASIVIISNEGDDDRTHRFISIIPKPKGPNNLIYYRHGDQKTESGIPTWLDMVQEINSFLLPYRRPENAVLCPVVSEGLDNATKSEDSVCLFDLNTVAKECLELDYGYMSGQPCIYIVFNNISNWIPQFESLDSENSTKQQSTNIVGLECTSNTQVDSENVGPMEFTPYQGFSPIFFPYKGQSNYMSPFVALRFPSPTHNVGIGLTCRIVAKNIANSFGSGKEPVPYIPFNLFIE